MKLLLLLAAVLVVGVSSAGAADVSTWRKPATAAATAYRVIPRSPEASLVWAGDACWRGCAMNCGRQFQACLSGAAPESCIAQNDGCDRFCLRECRFYGGPLLPID